MYCIYILISLTVKILIVKLLIVKLFLYMYGFVERVHMYDT